jgi:hypothetical protein
MIPSIADPLPSPVKGAFLDASLPAVYLLAIVAVLDDALSDYIYANGIVWPPRKRRDLCNRIDVVAGAVPAIDAARLHEVRQLRNSVAHPAPGESAAAANWDRLDSVIEIVGKALVAMGFLGRVPHVRAGYERTPTLFPKELGPEGERVRHRHRIFATVDGQEFLEYLTEITYRPPAP